MKCRTTSHKSRRPAGFTLAEVLAAMVFMAIVIPAAIEGLRVASLAGEVAHRKEVAARLGNNILNQLKVSGQLNNSGQRGVLHDQGQEYDWSLATAPWTEDTLAQMMTATVKVNFLAQGKSYEVDLTTLIPQQAL